MGPSQWCGVWVSVIVWGGAVAEGAEPTPTVQASPEQVASPVIVRAPTVEGMAWPAQRSPAEVMFEASTVIQVDGPIDHGNYTFPNSAAILSTSAIIEPAAKAVLKLDSNQARAGVQVVASTAGPNFTRLEIRLLKTEGTTWKREDADRLLLALVTQLQAALDESVLAKSRIREQSESEIVDELKRVSDRFDEIRTRQRKSREMVRGLPSEFRDLNNALQQATYQLTQAEQELKRNREQLGSMDPGPQSLLTEWEQLVKLRTEKLEQLRKNKVPDNEIKEAELQLTEARARLESFRATNGRNDRSDTNARNFARVQAQVQTGEKRVEELNAVIQKLESDEFRNVAEQEQRLRQEEQQVRSDIMQAESRLEQFRRQSRRPARFVITMLDGQPDKKLGAEEKSPAEKK